MASAIEHYREAEKYLALLEDLGHDDPRALGWFKLAELHKELAKVGVMALNDPSIGKVTSELHAWIKEVGHHEPNNKGPAAMRRAA